MTLNLNPRPNAAETPEMLAIVRERLRVDPKTGTLRWLRGYPLSNRKLSGTEAGTATGGGHRQVTIDCLRLKSSRIAFALANGRWPAGMVEHLDGDRANLRPKNLRDSTLSQINLTRRQPSGRRFPKGIVQDGGRYRAQVVLRGKRYSAGFFPTLREAEAAYAAKAKELWSLDLINASVR